jgi:uncharacterized protein
VTTFVGALGLISRSATPGDRAVEVPHYRLFAGARPLLFVVQGSRIYELDALAANAISSADGYFLDQFRTQPEVQRPVAVAPVAALSLNLAQACNLSCAYCYADEGRFGGAERLMPLEVALAAVDTLIDGADGRRLTIGFIGGEPFLNRVVLHRTVQYARSEASRRRLQLSFSVTTNGTLLTEADRALLRTEGFAVTISADGVGASNDKHRKGRGSSAWERLIDHVGPLLADPGSARIAARVTVPRDDLRVTERVEALAEAGFPEVGVSPLRASADPTLGLRDTDWSLFLSEMIRCATREWERVRAGGAWRFGNLAVSLKELHRGSVKELPCDAGAGYLSVDVNGHLYTCHRALGEVGQRVGDVWAGPDSAARRAFVGAGRVDRQEPCRSCWARYLCGGGCHAEVRAVGRTSCDYIRGWLEHCIRLYPEAAETRPDLFPEPVG